MNNTPNVEILVQPEESTRIRYEAEGVRTGLGGDVKGMPVTLKLNNVSLVNQRHTVRVSCVEHTEYSRGSDGSGLYRSHPNTVTKSTGKGKHKETSPTFFFRKNSDGELIAEINKVGIQMQKQNEIEASLKTLKAKQIDPFDLGFEFNKENYKSFDMKRVRLCFQVFIDGKVPLDPIVSNAIVDEKLVLSIGHISSYVAPVVGGKQIYVFCSNVKQEDVTIRFESMKNEKPIDLKPIHPDWHWQNCCIRFTTPAVSFPQQVLLSLFRISDQACSKQLPFSFVNEKSEDTVAPLVDLFVNGILDDDDDNDNDVVVSGDVVLGSYNLPVVNGELPPVNFNDPSLEENGVFVPPLEPNEQPAPRPGPSRVNKNKRAPPNSGPISRGSIECTRARRKTDDDEAETNGDPFFKKVLSANECSKFFEELEGLTSTEIPMVITTDDLNSLNIDSTNITD